MKRTLWNGMIALGGFAAAVLVFFLAGCGREESSKDLSLPDFLPASVLANRDALSLGADQVKRLGELRSALEAQEAKLQAQIVHCGSELEELQKAPAPDAPKVAKEKKEIEALRRSLGSERSKAEEAARAVLSGEQMEKIRRAREAGTLGPAAPLSTKELGVDAFLDAPEKNQGEVAIRGIVSQVFAEKKSFILIDADEFKTCGLECPAITLPVRMDRVSMEGVLPRLKDEVVVVADAKSEGKGFSLKVKEVRRGDRLLLRVQGGKE